MLVIRWWAPRRQRVGATRTKECYFSENERRPTRPRTDWSGQQLKIELAEREGYLKSTEGKSCGNFKTSRNITFDDVPLGGEEDLPVKKFMAIAKLAQCCLSDLRRVWAGGLWARTKVAGAKFYYLKGDLVAGKCSSSICLDYVTKQGFTFMTVPHMVNLINSEGAGFTPKGEGSTNM